LRWKDGEMGIACFSWGESLEISKSKPAMDG
jgi:hypothetical protein